MQDSLKHEASALMPLWKVTLKANHNLSRFDALGEKTANDCGEGCGGGPRGERAAGLC